MDPSGQQERTVDFQNFNEIKKKAVRGLLRKRAKKYTEEKNSSSDEEVDQPRHKKAQKASFS